MELGRASVQESEFSESTVLDNNDLADQDLFMDSAKVEDKGLFVDKLYNFSNPVLSPAPAQAPASLSAVDQMQKIALTDHSGKKSELMNRLVSRPARPGQVKTRDCRKMMAPHPPSRGPGGKPTGSYRTVMLKRDYQRRQETIKSKRNKDTDEEQRISVQMFNKPKVVKAPPKSVISESEPSDAGEDDVFAELAELMGPGTDTATIPKIGDVESSQSTPYESNGDMATKAVTFDELESEDEGESGSPRKMTEEDVMKVAGEIPIIEKRERPSSGATRPASANKTVSPSKSREDRGTSESRSEYDDSIPENDDVFDSLMNFRSKLGWKTEIPRHAPGCKAAMLKLRDIPNDNPRAARNMKEDDGDFVYCLLRNRKNLRGRYNPYELQIVSTEEAKKQKEYWTATASNITRCYEDPSKEPVSVSILWWMWEKRLFDYIFDLSVFSKFRLWKTFKNWRINIRLQKSTKSQVRLSKSLFVANEVLQGCLIHVRGLLEAASGSLTGLGEGEGAISLINLDKTATLTLSQFQDVQREQSRIAFSQLQALRDKIIQIVWESCATVAEMEGITHGLRDGEGRKVKITVPKDSTVSVSNKASRLQNKYGIKPYEEKKKKESKESDKPSYAEIAEWRKILNRLAMFLRSVDYLILEMLRRLVVTATRHLLNHLVEAYNVTEEMEDKYNRWIRSQQKNVSELDDSESSMSGSSFSTPTPRSRPLTRNSSCTSKQPPATADVTATGYVIPHFDFDLPELHEGPPDVDEVLAEVRKKDFVEEISAPAFMLELVLNVPQAARKVESRVSREQVIKTASIQSSYLKRAILHRGPSTGKQVKFHDEQDASGSEGYDSEGEYDSSESDEEEGREDEGNQESEDSSQSEKEEENDGGKEDYAYPESRTRSMTGMRAYVSLSPSEQEFKHGIRDVVSGFENTIAKFVSMTREPRLSVFCSPPVYDLKLNFDEEEEEERKETMRPWPDIDFVFGSDPEYQALLGELGTYMTMELELVRQYSTNFEQYCVMVDKSLRLNVDESLARRQWSTEEFSTVLAAHTEMVRQMKKMMTTRRIAMIRVDSQNYRASCLPYTEDIVSKVSTVLPMIAIKRNDDLLTIIKGASRKLDHYPKSVEEFVEHLSFLGKMTSELPALDKEFEVVNKLFTIAKSYNVQVTPEELALFQTLGPSFMHLKSTILYSEAKKDENIRKFSRDLEALIYNIRSKLMDLKNRVRDPDLLHVDSMAVTVLESIRYLQEEVQLLSVKARSYASYQERFGSSLSHTHRQLIGEEFMYMNMTKKDERSSIEIQTDLSEIERDLTLRRLLWSSQEEWTKLVEEWTATSFDALQVELLQKNVSRFTQTVYMIEKGLPTNEVLPRLKEKVIDFKQGMPVITSLRNPSLRPRHWQQIENLIGKTISTDKSFTLGSLLEMNIFRHKDAIQDISTTASNEATLEGMLQKIIDLWQTTDFRYVAHTGRDTFIIGGADDILVLLEESQVTVGTIRGSRYVKPIKAQVEEWERKLNGFAKTLDEWMTCQRNWLYLEQIFSAPDIQRQIPNEYKLFHQVDKTWKDLMRRVQDRPNALKSAIAPGTLDLLQSCNSNLEKIQKCLEDYLETKRIVFPRFYFLSNDELLEILGQSKDPHAVQPHLGKCFGNIKSLEIKLLPRQPPTVKSMMSAEGEVVTMPRSVRARGLVETWLGSVEQGMYETVKKHLKLGLADWLGIELQDWVKKHPGQVVLTVAQIMFNKDVSRCFDQADPQAALRQVLDSMIVSLSQLASLVSTPMLHHQTMCVEALLTIDVHCRDIISRMISNEVIRKDDFQWTKQLRYEWDELTNNCLVYQSNATFQYGYEYLGCSSRLVITPLTDRCYLTLTGALHLNLGGSPAGPAGTGKTETTKDLAKAMGKQCVVFNCSEGLDYKMLGKFFSGLAQSGSWCCFDEFNRIDLEVLSVVAQQILTIKTAKDIQALRFMFEGRDIKLNATCGYFITMNPTYAGRVELPDNLKSLFRQVAMMVPDYALIAEIMLFSEGFQDAKSLSRKIVNLYQLASRQLSQQDHYDFGMRAIKSVLVMAGHGRLQAQQRLVSTQARLTEKEEAFILIHSLRDANLPKFLAEDVPLFESILDDLFPGIVPPQPDHGILEKAISMSVRDQGLQSWPNQIDKVKQLYNQILVRHGVMLVGPTGGGKTTVRSILQRALVLLPTISSQEDKSHDDQGATKKQSFVHNRAKKGHCETFTINPKCVKLGELYGETDPNTYDWTDGLIASAVRKFSKELTRALSGDDRPVSAVTTMSEISQPTTAYVSETVLKEEDSTMAADGETEQHDDTITDWRWLVLDGPVDTLWVENLNTVLDDSKVLCLASGERVSLAPGMRLIFEVDNLSQASPATISRCAMVYMDPVDLGWKPYVKTWIQKLPRDMPDSGKRHLQALFDYSIDKGLKFFHKYHHYQSVPAPEMSLISCLCNILSALFDFMSKHGGFGNPDKAQTQTKPDLELSAHTESDLRSESRASSRSSSRTRRRRQFKRPSKIKEDMVSIDEQSTKSASSSDAKQYYLQRNPQLLCTILGKLYVFAYTWGMGGNFKRREDIDDDDLGYRRGAEKVEKETVNICNEFDNFMREMFDVEPPLGVRMPTGNKTIYSYFVDMETGHFVPWDVLVPSTKSLIDKGAVITIGESMGVSMDQKKEAQDNGNIVPTVDVIRFSFLTSLMLTSKHPLLITGESGVGKSAVINYALKQLGEDGGTSTRSGTILGSILNFSEKGRSLLENISNLTHWGQRDQEQEVGMDILMGMSSKPKTSTGILSSMIQFSAQTTASRLQAQIKHGLIQKGKNTLGAPRGRKVVLFVDDLNMPAPEEYGAQPPLELLRQFLEGHGFYQTDKMAWKEIMDVTVVSACGPPGGGRNPVSPRLLKNFNMLAFPQPSTRSLQHIYQVQLGRFFSEDDFSAEVKECLLPLVSAAIAMYYKMGSSMLPTPAKSHYTFNIRDLSKVIQGLLQANESVIVSRDNAAQLFAHEATRVFHDRLVCAEDRKQFYQFLSDNLHDHFKVKWSAQELYENEVVFGDFFDVEDLGALRVYRPMTDWNKLRQTFEEYYMRMNFGNTKLTITWFHVMRDNMIQVAVTGANKEKDTQMVFFKGAVQHICRAARTFSQPGGHMMMVGLDGTGKSTVAQLASFIANCDLFKLTLHRGYGTAEFRDDLKKVFLLAGVKGKNIIFLLTDTDIVKESFLEDINCILNSGEVPDLFDNEEVDGITVDLKQAAVQADVPDTRQSVYQFFIERVRQKLHIVLTMSPTGGRFRQRCRMNPSLINCCTIDWYDDWDEEAMLSVAHSFFEDATFMAEEDVDIEELKKSVGEMCVGMHKSVTVFAERFWEEMRRHYYSTPSSYMELIRLYSKILKENQQALMDSKERLNTGLFKLSEANSLVGIMKQELVSLGPQIEEKQRDTEVLMEQLEKDTEAVNQVRDIVTHEESIMKKETQIVQDYADECQKDLASVLPALQQAIASLETLDKASISEIRVYTSPPLMVSTVMNAVCVLFQKKPDWATAKQMLGDPNFLKKLLQFDKNSLPDKVFNRLKRYSKQPDFKPEIIQKVSLACRSICEWVLALEHYNEVYKMVKPKQKRVEEAREALKLAQNSLTQKQASLKKIQDHLNIIEEQYQKSVAEREGLKDRKTTTGLRLQRASILISALADEKIRWAESVNKLDFKLQGVVGDSLISAAATAYIGPFTAKYRRQLINEWVESVKSKNIPITKTFDLMSIVDAYQVLKWQNEGLPRDTHSTANAIMIKNASKWPLLIDPQGQASAWIKEMEGSRLKIVSASDPNYTRTLETAIRVGDPVLMKDVTEFLDPALRSVLMKETFRRGGHFVIKLGETEIEYNQNFRLYLSTSMSNPHYLPAVYIQVNIINFTVTFDGLQEQLLSAVVKQERPQLENQRSELLESIASDLQFLRDLEDKSLGLLQKAEGHLLDDQDLVDTLKQSKGKAAEIYSRVSQSEETEKRLSLARKRYLPVATRGATLYFVLADLSGIDVMYQFSLDWFQDMFTACISGATTLKERERRRSSVTSAGVLSGTLRRSGPRGLQRRQSQESDIVTPLPQEQRDPVELKRHMLEMINRMTYSIYRVVSVALFAHHQLTFSFMLNTSIMRAGVTNEDITGMGSITDFEWHVFLQGNIMASMMDDAVRFQYDGLGPMERLEAQAQGGLRDTSKHRLPPAWVTDSMWKQCQHLNAEVPAFTNICRSMVSNKRQWQFFVACDDPYLEMQKPYDAAKAPAYEGPDADGLVLEWESLTQFQRLILIKILRPDMLTASTSHFVKDNMGDKYLSSGSFDLKEIYEESTAKTPLIFILSPSCDPAAQLLRFAKELRNSTLHLDMISLGRGQGPKAEELISKAQILKGRWVFLQNCHLAASWMPRLQTVVENFNRPGNDEVDPQFRLWLSSKPDPNFPVSILQTGMKMTVEPPRGLKANMLRAYGSGGTGVITEKLFEDATPGPAWKKLLFGLCLFNSVLHERKKYGALGWNIAYEFNDSDLEVSILQLQMLLTEHDTIPWDALGYLIGGVTYGGRVTDDWDRRCLHALLGRFFCPEALQPDYSYSPNKMYQPVKPGFNFNDVVKYIDRLPDYDSSEVFGMTENAEKACRELQASDLIDTIISVQPRLSSGLIGAQKSNDVIVKEIASEILRKLPQTVDQEDDGEKHNLPYTMQIDAHSILTRDLPDVRDKERNRLMNIVVDKVMGNSALATVLRQEVDRFNNLLHIIHVSLKDVILAIKGEIIMSEPLEEAYNAMLNQKVPLRWRAAAYESKKPLASWVKDLSNRVEFLQLWCELLVSGVEHVMKRVVGPKGTAQSDLGLDKVVVPRCHPQSFWLSGFFFPQGFLTGVLQNHARKVGISVDSLHFDFHIKRSSSDTVESLSDLKKKVVIKETAFKKKGSPEDGVLVFGLYLDGARWDPDTGTLQDSLPGQRFSHLPEIHFKPVQTPPDVQPNLSDAFGQKSSRPPSEQSSRSQDRPSTASPEVVPKKEPPPKLPADIPGSPGQPDSRPNSKSTSRQSSRSQDSPALSRQSSYSEGEPSSAEYFYECPLYRTSQRAGTLSSTGHSTNFVTAVYLPSDCQPDFWVMRGVALLCQPDM